MKIRKNGRIVRLTESDLKRITKKILREQKVSSDPMDSKEFQELKKTEEKVSKSCGNFKKIGKETLKFIEELKSINGIKKNPQLSYKKLDSNGNLLGSVITYFAPSNVGSKVASGSGGESKLGNLLSKSSSKKPMGALGINVDSSKSFIKDFNGKRCFSILVGKNIGFTG
jgi:hypothetical protein